MIHGLINISAGGKLKSVKTFLAFAQKKSVLEREEEGERGREKVCVEIGSKRAQREWVGGGQDNLLTTKY